MTGECLGVVLHLEITVQDRALDGSCRKVNAMRNDIAVVLTMNEVLIRRKLELAKQSVILNQCSAPTTGLSSSSVVSLKPTKADVIPVAGFW